MKESWLRNARLGLVRNSMRFLLEIAAEDIPKWSIDMQLLPHDCIAGKQQKIRDEELVKLEQTVQLTLNQRWAPNLTKKVLAFKKYRRHTPKNRQPNASTYS